MGVIITTGLGSFNDSTSKRVLDIFDDHSTALYFGVISDGKI